MTQASRPGPRPQNRPQNRPQGERPPNARQRTEAAAQAAQRRRDRRLLAIVVGAVVLVLVAAGIGVQAYRSSRTPTVADAPLPTDPTPYTVAAGKPVVFGSPDAKVTVTLWEDFHCPGCGQFEQKFGPVLADAQAKGELKQEVYLLSFHDPGSAPAANAFACATESGFGQSYFDGLFANQNLQWNDDQLLSLAGQVFGAVPDTFAPCVTEKRQSGYVDSMTAAGNAAGITGTPTVFLNGTPVNLANLTPETLTAMIDEASGR